MNVKEAIYDLLNAATEVTTGLDTFNFGSGNEAAIFTVEPEPESTPSKFIVIRQLGGGASEAETRGQRAVSISCQIGIYSSKTYSDKALNELASKAWETLHRATLTLESGYGEVGCYAEPPQRLSDRDGFPGYIINVRVDVLEN